MQSLTLILNLPVYVDLCMPHRSPSSWSGLNAMENDALDSWVEKFKHYNEYPIVGKVHKQYIQYVAVCTVPFWGLNVPYSNAVPMLDTLYLKNCRQN